jgi:hypothetical protein
MKCMLELTVSAVAVLAVAAGCGGTSSNAGNGTSMAGASATGAPASQAGASSTGGGASSTSGGASSTSGGASSTSGGASSTSGGASSGSGGPFTTSVPASTQIGSLTPAQLTQICSDVQKFTQTLDATVASYECQSFALISAATAQTDAAAEAACKASLASCVPTAATPTGMCTGSATTCTATVGEATTCFNDLNAALQSATASQPSCDGLTVAKATAALAALAGDGGTGLSYPPSCTKLDMECPGSNVVPPMN